MPARRTRTQRCVLLRKIHHLKGSSKESATSDANMKPPTSCSYLVLGWDPGLANFANTRRAAVLRQQEAPRVRFGSFHKRKDEMDARRQLARHKCIVCVIYKRHAHTPVHGGRTTALNSPKRSMITFSFSRTTCTDKYRAYTTNSAAANTRMIAATVPPSAMVAVTTASRYRCGVRAALGGLVAACCAFRERGGLVMI